MMESKIVELQKEDGGQAHVLFLHKDKTTSTMDDMREYLANTAEPFPAGIDAVVIVADMQTAGRGTGTRTWMSATRGNLYCTLALPLVRVRADLCPLLPLVLAVALHRVLAAAVAPQRVHIKWPNDILAADGRKLAGTLLECRCGAVAAGVGVNIAAAPVLSTGRAAASLADLCGGDARVLPSPEDVARALCRELFALATGAEGRDALLAEYRCSVDWKAPVHERAMPDVPLVALGITDDGHLLVRRPDGSTDTLIDSYLV